MKYLSIIILFCPLFIWGQNLIPNPSFEDTLLRTTPLYGPEHWKFVGLEGWNYMTPFNNSTPQHLQYSAPNNFAGYQQAKTGSSYILLMVYDLYTSIRSSRREYIQVKLDRPLVFDSSYCMRMYISLADSFHFASKGQLGVYFSTNSFSVNHINNIPYSPQVIVSPNNYINDKVNWVEYNMQYKAQGGEEYLTIGNFNDTTSIDTQLVAGGGNEVWMEGTYYYIDDIWLSSCDSLPNGSSVSIKENEFRETVNVYPNPFEQNFTLTSLNRNLRFQLFNVLGEEVSFQLSTEGNKYQFSVGNVPKGMYLLQVSDGFEQASMRLLKE